MEKVVVVDPAVRVCIPNLQCSGILPSGCREVLRSQEMERESLISEDELHRGQEQIQETTNQFVKQVDEISNEKEQEIMTV